MSLKSPHWDPMTLVVTEATLASKGSLTSGLHATMLGVMNVDIDMYVYIYIFLI